MQHTVTAVRKDAVFLALTALILVVMGSVLRALLFFYNASLGTGIPAATLGESFVIGVRFDLIIASYLLLPLTLCLFLPNGLGQRKLARLWLGASTFAVIFLGIMELDFYREFHTRLNSLVFQYIREDSETVLKMVWAGFPVVRYLILVTALWLVTLWAINRANSATLPEVQQSALTLRPLAIRSGLALVVLLLFVIGARGTIKTGPPLRWGDAVHSDFPFANHLGLNGTFTLIKAASAMEHSSQSNHWRKRLPADDALQITRQLVMTAQDQPLPAAAPLARLHTPSHSYPKGKVRNVVFIIMESFAASYVGALGDSHQVTPAFDQLASQGLLFRRFFSNGTHTHQGMFASVACFPNLPGHEYLMQESEGNHQFSGLPSLLPGVKNNNVYVYNGDFRWDNQEGFFRNQGMTRFVGRDDIDNPGFMDDVWGVSDRDMFRQASKELNTLATNGPFYAVLQTLSNHTPFSLPDPLPVERVTNAGEQSEHLTAMRYADWALGQFFADVSQQSWYGETLFVIVGDHGFSNNQILSAVDLNRFHVPLLILAPGIQDYFGTVNDTVASQVDLVPTAMSLLGKSKAHSCWGRDILSLPANDPGFAVIKPSGSDQTTAIIKGDQVLTLNSESTPETGKLSYTPQLQWQPAQQSDNGDTLRQQLEAFIQTALDSLSRGAVEAPSSLIDPQADKAA